MSQYAKVATDAVKKIASHPTVANALNTTQRHVEAVTDATGTVFTETVHKNLKELSSSKYIVSDTKQKQELYKHAFYTSVSECVPLRRCCQTVASMSAEHVGAVVGAVVTHSTGHQLCVVVQR